MEKEHHAMIKKAGIKDSSTLAYMAIMMWQDSSVLELEKEL